MFKFLVYEEHEGECIEINIYKFEGAFKLKFLEVISGKDYWYLINCYPFWLRCDYEEELPKLKKVWNLLREYKFKDVPLFDVPHSISIMLMKK